MDAMTAPSRADLPDAVTAASERVIRLVQSAPDVSVRVPASPDWTVAQALGHLLTVTPRYSKGPRGGGTWAETPNGLPEINASELASVSGLTLDATAQALRESLAGVLAQVKGYGDHQPAFRFHGGGMIRADTALGVLLGEFLIHGRDIAEALGRPWWIDRHDAALVIDAVQPILPGWVDPGGAKGLSATFDLRIRGAGAYTWTFEDGRLEVRPGSPLKADCRISADAPAFLLVMYRRQSQWRPIFRGRLAAWGRRPWLALNLADKFYKP